MKKTLKRLKNGKVLLSVISGVLMILLNLNVIDQSIFDQYLEVANLVLGIGVAIGIISNPETPLKKPKDKPLK